MAANQRTKQVSEQAMEQHSINATFSPLGTCTDVVVSGNGKMSNFGTVKFDILEMGAVPPISGNAPKIGIEC
jgi:hypothetical protein